MAGRKTLVLGALLAAAGIGLGAFAAHGLQDRLESLDYGDTVPQRLEWFQTGVRYHLYHAMGLVVLAALQTNLFERSGARWPGVAFLLGIVLFSGSLYAMTAGPDSWKVLGAVVPLGGLCFLAGWLGVAYAGWQSGRS